MNINKLSIENITVFEDFKLNASNGVNVIIGENGTGKTHLIKLIYGVGETSMGTEEDAVNVSNEFFRTKPSNLVRDINIDKELKSAFIIDYGYNGSTGYFIHNNNQQDITLEVISETNVKEYPKYIFIPAKEMLSHSKGFLALNNKYDMPFDKTYVDIITNAELPETKEVSPINKKILDIISKVIDGTVIYENDTFYILKDDKRKIEFSLEAEGLRKFGLLYKLIRNGLIEKDTILLWDEPEANINPSLIPVLVDIFLELQREGVQVFIATHSYNLAKYFEIKRNKTDKVLFHSLYKTENGVKSQSNEYFGELDNNIIIKADSKLLDDVIEESLED
ncbi:MAG: AAA family ATPase [Paraclostridium sp.]|uniref:AAA family ATPase n=1 Tax=Paraclostridium sp. TaxID=2023273 RepID=UPI003F3524C9